MKYFYFALYRRSIFSSPAQQIRFQILGSAFQWAFSSIDLSRDACLCHHTNVSINKYFTCMGLCYLKTFEQDIEHKHLLWFRKLVTYERPRNYHSRVLLYVHCFGCTKQQLFCVWLSLSTICAQFSSDFVLLPCAQDRVYTDDDVYDNRSPRTTRSNYG